MSNSTTTHPQRELGSSPRKPKAIIHKRILDAAESSPSDSIEEISDRVSGASVELVERVIEEYGDPADGGKAEFADQGTAAGTGSASEDEDSSSPEAPAGTATGGDTQSRRLTNKQRKTLETILERPDATQRELAERLDVTSATICNRVNAIQGFEWKYRHEIAREILHGTPESDGEPGGSDGSSGADEPGSRERATARRPRPAALEPELVSKVIRACVRGEDVSEDEELRVITYFIESAKRDGTEEG